MTALPIVETQEGDVSAYIPTNVISITDGQIFLSGDIFNAGIRPAINVGISVSRVGSAAQPKAMKQVAGKLKLELARGQRLRELLKQAQTSPLSLEDQVASIYAGTNGYLDKFQVEQVRSFLIGLRQYLAAQKSQYGEILRSTNVFNDEAEKLLKEAISEYSEEFLASTK